MTETLAGPGAATKRIFSGTICLSFLGGMEGGGVNFRFFLIPSAARILSFKVLSIGISMRNWSALCGGNQIIKASRGSATRPVAPYKQFWGRSPAEEPQPKL